MGRKAASFIIVPAEGQDEWNCLDFYDNQVIVPASYTFPKTVLSFKKGETPLKSIPVSTSIYSVLLFPSWPYAI